MTLETGVFLFKMNRKPTILSWRYICVRSLSKVKYESLSQTKVIFLFSPIVQINILLTHTSSTTETLLLIKNSLCLYILSDKSTKLEMLIIKLKVIFL